MGRDANRLRFGEILTQTLDPLELVFLDQGLKD